MVARATIERQPVCDPNPVSAKVGQATFQNTTAASRILSGAFTSKGSCAEGLVARVAGNASFSGSVPIGALFLVRSDDAGLSLKRVIRASVKTIAIGDGIEVKVTCTGATPLSTSFALDNGQTVVVPDVAVGSVCTLLETDGDNGFNARDNVGAPNDNAVTVRARAPGCPTASIQTKVPSGGDCYNEVLFTN